MSGERETAPRADRAIPLAVWRELDWRMLLPGVELGRILYVGRPSALLDEALNRVARDVRVVAAADLAERGVDAQRRSATNVAQRLIYRRFSPRRRLRSAWLSESVDSTFEPRVGHQISSV